MDRLDLDGMFAAGAKSVAYEHGMGERDASLFADRICKAAAKSEKKEDDDEEDGSTWFGRNGWWAVPTGVGLGAFLLGADAGRGRPDRNPFYNAGSHLWKRVKNLLGINYSTFWRSLTEADPKKLKEYMS